MGIAQRFFLGAMVILFICPKILGEQKTPSPTRIVVIVNREIITASDVQERIRLINLSSGKPVNTSVSEETRKQIIQGMVDELLQLHAVKQKKITISDTDVEASLAGLAKDNNMSLDAMLALLKSNGISKKTMMDRLRIQIAWARFIREMYGPLLNITDKEVDKTLQQTKNIKPKPFPPEMMDITLCQAIFSVSPDTPSEIMAIMEPKIEETYQTKGCQAFLKAAGGFGAKVDANRVVKLGQLPDSLKSMVQKTKAGTCLQPTMTPDGLVLTMVCSKTMPSLPPLPEPTRESATREIEQRELGKRSAQEMAKLKTAAFIDWKE